MGLLQNCPSHLPWHLKVAESPAAVDETLSLWESCYHVSLLLFSDNNKQENVCFFLTSEGSINMYK